MISFLFSLASCAWTVTLASNESKWIDIPENNLRITMKNINDYKYEVYSHYKHKLIRLADEKATQNIVGFETGKNKIVIKIHAEKSMTINIKYESSDITDGNDDEFKGFRLLQKDNKLISVNKIDVIEIPDQDVVFTHLKKNNTKPKLLANEEEKEDENDDTGDPNSLDKNEGGAEDSDNDDNNEGKEEEEPKQKSKITKKKEKEVPKDEDDSDDDNDDAKDEDQPIKKKPENKKPKTETKTDKKDTKNRKQNKNDTIDDDEEEIDTGPLRVEDDSDANDLKNDPDDNNDDDDENMPKTKTPQPVLDHVEHDQDEVKKELIKEEKREDRDSGRFEEDDEILSMKNQKKQNGSGLGTILLVVLIGGGVGFFVYKKFFSEANGKHHDGRRLRSDNEELNDVKFAPI